MNCNKLHEALATKDQEIKERKENTIAAFEYVKDWALETLIQKTIDNEFKSYSCLYEGEVYQQMFKMIGADVSPLHFEHFYCFGREKQGPIYTFCHVRAHISRENGNDEHIPKAIESLEKIDNFKERFDHKMFWNLLDSHILKNGFKTYKMKNIHGQTVVCKYDYVTTRSALERACCPPVATTANKEEDMTIGDIFAIGVVVLIFLSFAAIIFTGFNA